MTVPRLLVLTDRLRCRQAGRDLPATLAAIVGAGAPAVVLREKDLGQGERARLAAEVAEVVRPSGARLLVASDPELARQVGAQGVHLAAADPLPTHTWPLLGRSCHDVAEVREASTEPIDYLTVSPVNPSTSKPGHGPPLRTTGTAELVAAAGVPVVALGGIEPHDVPPLLDAGVHGVAVMGGLMGAADPAATTDALLRALGGSP